MGIRLISKECIASSSVKGFPRIIKSESRILRMFWVIGSFFLLSICAFQTYVVTKEFLEYPVSTSIKEEPIKFSGPSAIRVPDIFICNLNPFASATLNIADNLDKSDVLEEFGKNLDHLEHLVYIPTVDDYLDDLERVTECFDGFDCGEMFKYMDKFMKSSVGYFQYIGWRNAVKLAQPLEDFIIECSVTLLKGARTTKEDCAEYIQIGEVPNEEYFVCYDLRFPHVFDTAIVGISLTIYLDSFNDPFASERWLHKNTGKNYEDSALGLVLYLYEPNTLPSLAASQVYAAPGMLTDIKYLIEEVTRLSEPYGSCFKRGTPGKPSMFIDPDINFTTHGCLAHCMGKYILDHCKCIDVEISGTIFLR